MITFIYINSDINFIYTNNKNFDIDLYQYKNIINFDILPKQIDEKRGQNGNFTVRCKKN